MDSAPIIVLQANELTQNKAVDADSRRSTVDSPPYHSRSERSTRLDGSRPPRITESRGPRSRADHGVERITVTGSILATLFETERTTEVAEYRYELLLPGYIPQTIHETSPLLASGALNAHISADVVVLVGEVLHFDRVELTERPGTFLSRLAE